MRELLDELVSHGTPNIWTGIWRLWIIERNAAIKLYRHMLIFKAEYRSICMS